MGRRPTMADVARLAGVSRVAVSYALNDRPGVSEETRQRVLAVAAELGFTPNTAAQAMHGGVARTVGLVLRRPSEAQNMESFRRLFIAGLESELLTRSYGLLLQFVGEYVEEVAVHAGWWARRQVDGVLVLDPLVQDPRLEPLEKSPMPSVLVGTPPDASSLPHVWSDEAAGMAEVFGHLGGLGHRRIVWVGGPSVFVHSAKRAHALDELCERHGLSGEAFRVEADYSSAQGQQVTRRLLSADLPPTAIIYENEMMTLAGLSVAREMGVSVPDQLSLLAFEDSPLCEMLRPSLTALHRNTAGFGAAAARLLLDLIDGRQPGPVRVEPGQLIVRDSTAPPPQVQVRT